MEKVRSEAITRKLEESFESAFIGKENGEAFV